MVERIKSSKIDPRLISIMSSPYVQQHLQLAGLINYRGQMVSYDDYFRSPSPRKRQRREREAITQEIVSRAMKIDQSHQRSRRHQFEIAARRLVNNNFDILSRQYRKQSDIRTKSRQRSAPGSLVAKGYNDGERRSRITTIVNKRYQSNKDLSTIDRGENPTERVNKLSLLTVERHACEVTMTYGSKGDVKVEYPTRDEIVVMQQHSTGENLVVYRGFLAKGESFSFKSQRRSTSALCLAFYAKGFIDSVVNDCCEYRYGRRSKKTNEDGQFWIDKVRKANPCEKCRRRYSQRTATPSSVYTPTDVAQSDVGPQRHSTPTLKIPEEHSETKSMTRSASSIVETPGRDENNDKRVTNKQKNKRISSSKKQPTKERPESINYGLLETALIQDDNSSKPKDSVPSDSVSDLTVTTDSGNLIQLAMTQLKQELEKHQAQSSGMERHEKSVENFIYVLDGNLPISDKERKKLRGLINFGLTLNDLSGDVCLEFIHQIVHEQIIMILSRSSMKNLDTNIQNASQLRLIYVVDGAKDEFDHPEKIRGIYNNLTSVCDQLEKDIKLLTRDLMTILSAAVNDTDDSNFAYVQVLKDILLENEDKTDLKREMLDFCRQQYADNEVQLKFIDEFQNHFQPDDAVKWYLRQETFLFKILARACRIPNPDILFKLRFFLQYLHRQLKSNTSSKSMTIYRTQHIANGDFNTIATNRGGFLAFSQFLLTSKTKVIPKRHAKILSSNKSDCKLIHFQMELGPNSPTMIIEPSSEEVLLTLATVFRITDIQQTDKEIFLVKLTTNDDVMRAVQEVTERVREAAQAPFPLLRMARLMKQMEYIYYTEYFCHILIDDSTAMDNEAANLILGGLFHTLCSFYYEQEQYDHALEQLEKSLKVYSRVLSVNDIKLTPTYNNMGSIYHKKGLDELALQFHKKAYDIQVTSSNPDPDSVAAYAGNIASVLIKQGKYEEAIPYLQRDLQIRQRLYHNADDINLAVKYHNLAGAQFRINQFADALENYKKCLDIELKVHPSNHPTVAVTYYNMATALEGLGQLQEAIESIEKAKKRLLLTKAENDEEVQMHEEYEKRLQQKLWVKSLFANN